MDSIEKSNEVSKVPSPEEILDLVREDKLTLAKLRTLIEIHPGIVQSSIQSFDALIETTKGAGNSQNEAMRTIRESIAGLNDTLKVLAEKSETDATREKIAEVIIEIAKLHSSQFETVRKMNSSNNKTWKNIGKLVIAGLALVATGAAAAVFGRK